jgi:hypothetical protein
MEALQFKVIPEYLCLYINGKLIVFFYVDDIVAMFHPKYRPDYLKFKKRICKRYEMRDIGELKWFLGIRIIRDRL